MTSERDIERLLDRWFTDRPTVVADRVLDEVADRIGRQPQQRAWRVLRRDSHVNSYLKPLLAVAAVVVIAVAGVAYSRTTIGLGRRRRRLAGPFTIADCIGLAIHGPIGKRRVSGVVHAGAAAAEPGSCPRAARRPSPSCPAPRSASRRAGSTTLIRPISSGCSRTRPPTRPSSLAPGAPPKASSWGSLTPRPSSATKSGRLTAPRPRVGRLPGRQRGTCDVRAGRCHDRWLDRHASRRPPRPRLDGELPRAPDDPPTKDYKDYRGRFVFLDIPGGGKLLIIVDSVHAADFEALLAEAMPIVESFEFDLEP